MARSYSKWNDVRNDGNSLSNISPITTIANGKRYYSSSDAQIFIGNVFVDEVKHIAWQTSQNVMPIVGYNSYTFDDLAVGSRMVQGQFTINFTKAEYLSELLNDKDFVRISRKIYKDDPQVVSYFSDSRMARLNRPIYDSAFDIVVGFGDHNNNASNIDSDIYRTYGILECCQIQNHNLELDETGQVVAETYTFIARDYVYKNRDVYAEPKEEKVSTASVYSKTKSNIELSGEIDIKKSEAAIVISNTMDAYLLKGTLQLLDDFSNATLTTSIDLVRNADNQLVAIMSRDKTKYLSDNWKKYGYSKLKAQVEVTYKTEGTNSQYYTERTDSYTINLNIK